MSATQHIYGMLRRQITPDTAYPMVLTLAIQTERPAAIMQAFRVIADRVGRGEAVSLKEVTELHRVMYTSPHSIPYLSTLLPYLWSKGCSYHVFEWLIAQACSDPYTTWCAACVPERLWFARTVFGRLPRKLQDLVDRLDDAFSYGCERDISDYLNNPDFFARLVTSLEEQLNDQ